MGTFSFSPDKPWTKNRDFHQNSLYMRVPILGKQAYFNDEVFYSHKKYINYLVADCRRFLVHFFLRPYRGVQLRVQYLTYWGPNMTAIISVRKQIWVQSQKSRWVLPTLISGRISSRGTFQLLHSYLFPNSNDWSHISTLL